MLLMFGVFACLLSWFTVVALTKSWFGFTNLLLLASRIKGAMWPRAPGIWLLDLNQVWRQSPQSFLYPEKTFCIIYNLWIVYLTPFRALISDNFYSRVVDTAYYNQVSFTTKLSVQWWWHCVDIKVSKIDLCHIKKSISQIMFNIWYKIKMFVLW